MPYLPESSIITTTDGIQCQVYMSDHPRGWVIVKPKYIPTDKIESRALPYRYISGRKMNRLNMWIPAKELKAYLKKFKKAYPEYIHENKGKDWFFAVPIEKIEKVYDSRRGLRELLRMPKESLDEHLRNVVEFVAFLKKSGVPPKDLGVTYSTLVGHYYLNVSDINLVVYGKNNFWKVMHFLDTAKHPKLRWKTDVEWVAYHKRRGRSLVLTKDEFLFHAKRKKWEGFWNGNLFLILGVEKPYEVSVRWDDARESLGLRKIKGKVKSDASAGVRPGIYELADAEVIGGKEKILVSQVIFYSRNFALQAKKGEIIEAQGTLEKVSPKKGGPFYRLVTGYFGSYPSGQREKEYIKVIR